MEGRMAEVAAVIARDIETIARMVLESNNLINDKVGRNTIAPDSELYKTLKVVATEDGDLVFDLMLNDYLVYIEGGRRIGAKFPPIKPIVEWAKRRGIPTDNSTIFLIRRAISRDGIRPRPFMELIFEEMDEFWNSGEWSDKIFAKIMEKIDNFFNQ